MLRANLRDLRTEAGEHYADILLSLYQRQLKELHEEQETDRAEAEAVQIAAQAGKSDQQADQAEAAAHAGAAQAGKSDRRMGHTNGSQVQQEAVRNVSGNGNSRGANGTGTAGPVDKSTLSISAPRRVRDKEHLRFVASQPCIVCGRSPGHAHHLRFAQPRALGRKVSDEWTVPLCAAHHRALHIVGDEKNWWKERQVNPITHATQLWREKRDASFHPPSRARELICP